MKTSRQLQAAETKRRIAACYLEMIQSRSADEIKISELCRQADVSVGTYYHYYKSKDSIICDIYERIEELFERHFDQLYGTLSAGSYVERILEYATCTVDEIKNRYGLKAMTTIYQLQMGVDEAFFLDTRRVFGQNLSHLLDAAVKGGELREDLDIPAAVLDMLCIIRGIVYSWCLLKGEFDIKKNIRTVTAAYIQQLR